MASIITGHPGSSGTKTAIIIDVEKAFLFFATENKCHAVRLGNLTANAAMSCWHNLQLRLYVARFQFEVGLFWILCLDVGAFLSTPLLQKGANHQHRLRGQANLRLRSQGNRIPDSPLRLCGSATDPSLTRRCASLSHRRWATAPARIQLAIDYVSHLPTRYKRVSRRSSALERSP